MYSQIQGMVCLDLFSITRQLHFFFLTSHQSVGLIEVGFLQNMLGYMS